MGKHQSDRGLDLLPMMRWAMVLFSLGYVVGSTAWAVERSVIPEVIEIPAGKFVFGSDRDEREAAYALDEQAYKHRVTREKGWYEREWDRHEVTLDRYFISRNVITNRQHRAFVEQSAHRVPDVDPDTWKSYRLIHPFEKTRRFSWLEGIPSGREDHPVVLVSREDAESYARWLSERTGQKWRLPSEREWEKAARGVDGRRFPWGDKFLPERLNSHDRGPFDTVPVGGYPAGASPLGLLDAAGQVFEWTSGNKGEDRAIVKGGSWDDKGCGVCRPAARHSRPITLKHILIGFRLVRE